MIIEYLKLILSWPVAIIFIIIYICSKFKPEISIFLSQLKKVEIAGAKFEASIAQSKIKNEEIVKSFTKFASDSIKSQTELLKKLRYEKIFNYIFGSQIDLLEFLKLEGEDGEKIIGLIKFYNSYILNGGNPRYEFKDYIGFLMNIGLIESVVKQNEQFIRITEDGKEFLSYIIQEYPLYKSMRPL